MDNYGYYWSLNYHGYSYFYNRPKYAYYMHFYPGGQGMSHDLRTTTNGMAVRLVILAED